MLTLVAATMMAGCVTTGVKVSDLSQGQSGWLSYPSSAEPIQLSGELLFPSESSSKLPAMILAHGSGVWTIVANAGQSSLGKTDTPRSRWTISAREVSRKKSTIQPVPTNDVFDALRLLTSHPRIDRGSNRRNRILQRSALSDRLSQPRFSGRRRH